ncbi:hypothetical protein C8Q79DRAFT_1008050 [Trametes meyenii]|nr:hypothetical protein C8Q79DRAFT_1008050 [Trametes meyenii]
MMDLLSLPDDVLHLILNYIHGTDALNVALTSKHLSGPALDQIVAVVACEAPETLYGVHQFLSAGPPQRALHLRSLTVDVCPEEAPAQDADGQSQPLPIPHLVADLLFQACNISDLYMSSFDRYARREPRIGAALSSLVRLRHMRLSELTDAALHILATQGSPTTVEHLTLIYDDDFYSVFQQHEFEPLLAALASLQRLRSLVIWNFYPRTFPHNEPCSHIQFPSVTDLRMGGSSAVSVELVPLVPRLSALRFFTQWRRPEPPGVTFAIPPPGRPRWAPLRQLMLGEHNDGESMLERLGVVDQLQISGDLEIGDTESPQLSRFLDLLGVASPVSLYLSVVLSCTPMTFWDRVVYAAPRLRVLDLKIALSRPALEFSTWLEDLAVGLQPFRSSLSFLRIFVPQLGGAEHLFLHEIAHDVYGNVDEDAVDAAREMEDRRVASMVLLPQRLVDALPALQYLVLLDGGRNKAFLLYPRRGPASHVPTNDAEYSEEGEWDELRRTDRIRSRKYWCVVDDRAGRTLEEISQAESDSAQRLIESPDWQSISR